MNLTKPAIYPLKNHQKQSPKRNKLEQKKLPPKIFYRQDPSTSAGRAEAPDHKNYRSPKVTPASPRSARILRAGYAASCCVSLPQSHRPDPLVG
jgi:hypothetical protein